VYAAWWRKNREAFQALPLERSCSAPIGPGQKCHTRVGAVLRSSHRKAQLSRCEVNVVLQIGTESTLSFPRRRDRPMMTMLFETVRALFRRRLPNAHGDPAFVGSTSHTSIESDTRFRAIRSLLHLFSPANALASGLPGPSARLSLEALNALLSMPSSPRVLTS
jgi:hypothetical protein